jgi:hypothetical protein
MLLWARDCFHVGWYRQPLRSTSNLFQFSIEKGVDCEAQRCFYTNDIITGIVW